MRAIDASRVFAQLSRVPSQAAKPVAQRISAEIQKRFDAGQDPYGRTWAPLAPATIAKGRRPPPLTDTGRGRASIAVKPTRGAGMSIRVGVPYMVHHQFGARKGRWNLPARPFLPLTVLPKEWNRIYQEEIAAMSARLFRGLSRG